MATDTAAVSREREDFILRLPRFEGPLDLLLYLIEKNRFTLEDLEVSPIIDQYLAYINNMRSLDMALAGEFLEMASYLIWLKSCLLLPSLDEDGEDEGVNPARELQEMLMAYREIKQAADELKRLPMMYRDRYPRGEAVLDDDQEVSTMSVGALLKAIAAIKARTREYVIQVARPRVSIREMMGRIQRLLGERDHVALHEVVPVAERPEFVAAFMAALEISKNSLAILAQHRLFGPIVISRRGTSGDDPDWETAARGEDDD